MVYASACIVLYWYRPMIRVVVFVRWKNMRCERCGCGFADLYICEGECVREIGNPIMWV